MRRHNLTDWLAGLTDWLFALAKPKNLQTYLTAFKTVPASPCSGLRDAGVLDYVMEHKGKIARPAGSKRWGCCCNQGLTFGNCINSSPCTAGVLDYVVEWKQEIARQARSKRWGCCCGRVMTTPSPSQQTPPQTTAGAEEAGIA